MADPSSIVKDHLSASVDGLGIKVAATSTAGTTIHVASAVTGDNNHDEVWIWAYNSHTGDVVLTIEYGGVADPDNHIVLTVPRDAGLVLVVPGLTLQNALEIAAFASVADKIVLYGFTNEITA